MRKLSITTGVAILTLTSVFVPASARADRSPVVITSEGNCLEFGEIGRITVEQAAALIPARYKAREAPDAPGMVNVHMGDYSCTAVSVNGGRPRPTMITMATVEIAERDGVAQPPGTTQPLWWGTDQPALTRAVQRLGAPARHVKGTTTITPMRGGTRMVHHRFSGSKVDHERIGVVEDISAEPLITLHTPAGYYTGSKGEIRFVYDMQFRSKERAANSIVVSAPDSDLVQKYGFPHVLTSKNTLILGKWTMRAELIG